MRVASLAQLPGAPLDEIVVTGEFPGPGMWRITHPDHQGHVLWIVGDPAPLPKKWNWKSKDIGAAVVDAREILFDVGVSMNADEKIGVLRGMTYLPAILKARRNPEDAEFADLLPPDLYARWLEQKKRYLGRDSGVERWRPLFAADKLRKAAFDELDMRESGVIADVVRKLARKHAVKMTVPRLELTFKRSELRGRIREFARPRVGHG